MVRYEDIVQHDAINEKIRILIVDDDRLFANTVNEYFSLLDGYEVLDCVYNGKDALTAIEEYQPAVVLLDMIMPYFDGLAVLEKLPELKLLIKPNIILLTAMGQISLTQKAMEAGAVYYMMKPVDLDTLDKRIRQMMPKAQPACLESTFDNHTVMPIAVALKKMRIPIHINGYAYIIDAVRSINQDKKLLKALTKELYPLIGEHYGVSSESVERALRNAISAAWDMDEGKAMREVFLSEYITVDTKPTNAQFFSFLTEMVNK